MLVKINGNQVVNKYNFVSPENTGEMVIKINNKPVKKYFKPSPYIKTGLEEIDKGLEEKVSKFGKVMIPASIAVGILTSVQKAFAASGVSGLGDRLMPLIHMVQEFALPIGIVVASWGLIEIIIGNPDGKSKIKYAVIGFVGMFLIPEVFYAIRDAFSGMGTTPATNVPSTEELQKAIDTIEKFQQ